jgi:hypothetical protein
MITILTRKDLIRESAELPIEDIEVSHVRGSLESVQRSDLVLIVDDKIKVIKDIYSSYTKVYHLKAMELLISRHLNDNG